MTSPAGFRTAVGPHGIRTSRSPVTSADEPQACFTASFTPHGIVHVLQRLCRFSAVHIVGRAHVPSSMTRRTIVKILPSKKNSGAKHGGLNDIAKKWRCVPRFGLPAFTLRYWLRIGRNAWRHRQSAGERNGRGVCKTRTVAARRCSSQLSFA